MAKFRVIKNKRHLRRRRMRCFLTVTVVAGVFAYAIHTMHASRVTRLEEAEATLASYQAQLDEIMLRQGFYENQIIRFEDEDYVTMFARERYFFSLPDEIIFRVIDPERGTNTLNE